MIVRILGEGQFEVAETEMVRFNELDDELVSAVQSCDEAAFQRSLTALVGRVREVGSICADDYLGESDFVLPDEQTTLDTVAELLADDGLVPG